MPNALGDPLIVNTPPEKLPVTPAGKPVTPAPVPLPPTLYVIAFIDVPTHTVWLLVPTDDVNDIDALAVTVIVPVAVACVHDPPVVVTV